MMDDCQEQSVAAVTSSLESSKNMRHPLILTSTSPKSSQYFMCNICMKFFDTKEDMMTHTSTHILHNDQYEAEKTDINLYECERCKILFKNASDLNLHILGHDDQVLLSQTKNLPAFDPHGYCPARTFDCSLCGKVLQTKGSLMKHASLHTGLKPFKCEICEKMFSIKGNRDKHMMIHSQQRPHECQICGKTFSFKGNLNQHILTHTGQKLFKCSLCEKEFTLKGNLFKHLKRHQNGLKIGKRISLASDEGLMLDEKKEIVPSGDVKPMQGEIQHVPVENTQRNNKFELTESRNVVKSENTVKHVIFNKDILFH